MASDVEVDVCGRCQGLWFDRGELERFPDRPSLRPLLATAAQASSRCRKGGHLVPRAMAACATCRSEPLGCPSCGGRLALVSTRVCTVDLCAHCGGTWLDAGKFEALAGVSVESVVTATSKARGWEVPEATAGGADPWAAPGARAPLPKDPPTGGVGSRSPFACQTCGRQVPAHEAWAWKGDLYCGEHAPADAVSGASLPRNDRVRTLPALIDANPTGWLSWIVELLR